MKYKKKPLLIEAIQYNSNAISYLYEWSNGEIQSQDSESYPLKCTFGDLMGIKIGDYIIKDTSGYHAMREEAFESLYELDSE